MSERGDMAVRECDRCGGLHPCTYTEDPYLRELYPEDEDSKEMNWWCDACFEERAGDI